MRLALKLRAYSRASSPHSLNRACKRSRDLGSEIQPVCARQAYWVRFQTGDAQITEAGWKLTIPRENRLSSSKPAIEAFLPSVKDHLSPLTEYWRVNKMLLGFESFLFMIERDEVEAGDISHF